MASTTILRSALLGTAIAFSFASALAQENTRLSVHFASASSELDEQALIVLEDLCDRIGERPPATVTITGHTDDRGSETYNLALSARRVEAVRRALEGTCLSTATITEACAGELEPLHTERTRTAYQGNRRVDVLLSYAEASAMATPVVDRSRVTPLLPRIDKPCERITVDASAPIDLTMSDGVRVQIPAGSIVDAQGRAVTGPIEVSYRSFHEPYEIIASGIPMHVEDGGTTQHMESAGMYEIYASRNGEPLALAEGGSIRIEPVTAPKAGEGYVTWDLDASTGGWVPAGTLQLAAPAPVRSMGNTTTGTQAYWTEMFRLESQRAPDSTLFAARRQSDSYCHLTACDTAVPSKSWLKRRNRFRRLSGVPEISVVAYKGMYDPEHVVFSISMPRKSAHQFPEWYSVPRNALFAYSGPEPRRVFKQLYGRRHFFQDIQLHMADGNTDGTLRLKENGQWIDLPVSVMRDPGSPLKAERWNKALVRYSKALAKREARFDHDVARRVTRYRRDHTNMPRTAWRRSRKAMTSLEKQMALTAWTDYADARPYQVPALPGASPWAMFAKERTSISVYGFGKVNCDRYLEMPQQANVIASTVDSTGKAFPWVRGYAVPKGRNAVITYMGAGDGRTDALLVAPGFVEALFLVDADGRVMRADVRPLNKPKNEVVLRVNSVGDPRTIDELRAQVGR